MRKHSVNCSEPKFEAMRDEFETQNDCTTKVRSVREKFNPMRVEFEWDSSDPSTRQFVEFMDRTWNS